jgi:hypothetical protein
MVLANPRCEAKTMKGRLLTTQGSDAVPVTATMLCLNLVSKKAQNGVVVKLRMIAAG